MTVTLMSVHTDDQGPAHWTVHVAGPIDLDGATRCTRCGVQLAPADGVEAYAWLRGQRVGTDGDGEWFALADARPLDADEAPCVT